MHDTSEAPPWGRLSPPLDSKIMVLYRGHFLRNLVSRINARGKKEHLSRSWSETLQVTSIHGLRLCNLLRTVALFIQLNPLSKSFKPRACQIAQLDLPFGARIRGVGFSSRPAHCRPHCKCMLFHKTIVVKEKETSCHDCPKLQHVYTERACLVETRKESGVQPSQCP